ncbi:MAG: hypothetical protein PHC68_02560 [Syntrophorhabdaceae bacterium]|jgi:hypothetical protein|nr:hypothetical protein [Syntrophorhabdaceae bacterium]
MRIVAMMSGGDWADASVEHIVISSSVDLDKVKEEYEDELHEAKKHPHYIYVSFIDWLKKKYDARDTTPEEVEEYWDY